MYQILAEQANEFETSKTIASSGGIPSMVAGLHQRVQELSKMLEGLREQLESLQNANHIAQFPYRYQPARLINPLEQIQAFYESITSAKDREVIEGKSRAAEVVRYRTQIMRRLLDFGASGPTVARIMKKDWGTIYYHTLPKVMAKRRRAGMRRWVEQKKQTERAK
jgi:hypothetical protein